MNTRRPRILRKASISEAPIEVKLEAVNGPRGVQVLPRNIADAYATAEAIVEAARARARSIEEAAQQDAQDRLVEISARAQADALCLVMLEVMELRKKRLRLGLETLDQSIDMAKLLAERLLGERLQTNPETIVRLAHQTLHSTTGARQAVLFAHPADAALIRDSLSTESLLLENIRVEADERLNRGHMRVQTELGEVDANIKGQLNQLAKQLRKLLDQ